MAGWVLVVEAVARQLESSLLAGVCEPLGGPAGGSVAAAFYDKPVEGVTEPGHYLLQTNCGDGGSGKGSLHYHCKTCSRL